jgi:hypothetical protein
MEADVTVAAAATDEEKVAEALDAIDLMDMQTVEINLTLPTSNATNMVAFSWASSDEAVIATDGTVVRVPGSDTNVTLTVTATSGAVSVDRNYTMVVLDANDMDAISVSDALAETDGANLLVEGIVTGTYTDWGSNEVVIQDIVTGAAIYVDFDVTGAVVGDHVIVRGDLETYTSFGNTKRQLDSGSLISIESSGNTVMVNAETDVAVIADDYAKMLTYTTTLTIKSFDSYGYVFFDGSATRDLKFSFETFAPYMADVYSVGDTLTVTFTVMDINFDHTRIVNVQLPALDDTQNMLAAKGALEVADTVTDSLTPVLALPDYDATITWASDTPAVIAADGTVVQPAVGELDATVVLTASVTVNGVTEDVQFTVTVPAIVESAYDFTETFTNLDLTGTSYADGSFAGDNSITWSYTESRGDFTLDGKAIMLDKDGDGASLTATITGGISALSIDYFDAYSYGAQVVIVINEGLAGEMTYTSTEVDFDQTGEFGTFTVDGINIAGEFTISIYSGVRQMVLDNFMWSGYTE